MRHLDDGAQDHRLAVRHLAHEGLVDLDRVEGEAQQIGEGGIAGAEIVERQARRRGRAGASSIWAEYSGFSITRLSVISSLSEPGRTPVRASTVFTSCSRSCRRRWRLDMLTLAKIGGSTSSAFCQAASSRAVRSSRKTLEIDDEPGLLGERQEILGPDAAEARMVPAQHRLEARDGAVLEPHDRLEQHLDLAAVERPAQIALQRDAVAAVGAHGRPEHLDAVAALALGVHHGDLGVLQHLVAARGDLRIVEGEADRGGEEHLALGEGDRRRHRAPDHVGEGDDAVRLALGKQDDGELVAGDARQGVLRLQQAAEPARQGEQDRIAGRIADGFVDLLEPVDVDDQHGRPQRRRPGSRR